jgi:hypothetical protein
MRELGRPPLPWQSLVSDLAGELVESPDWPGLLVPAYRTVVVVVPRRAGKSVGVLAHLLHRSAVIPAARCWYTAQTRGDAAETFREEWVPMVRESRALTQLLGRPRLSNGSEGWSYAGRRVALFAPNRTGLHGKDSDAVVVDEAFTFDAARGAELDAAITPTMKTRPHAQVLVVSAAGDASSSYLRSYVELGRAQAAGVAYVEFSADPDLDDLDDPALLDRVHPAVGLTIPRAALLDDPLRSKGEDGLTAWRRAYLGVWPGGTDGSPAAIPAALWTRQADDRDPGPPASARVAYGLEVAHDRGSATLVAAWRDAGGHLRLEVLEHAPGTSWVPGRVRAVMLERRGTLHADAAGPTGPVVDELRRDGQGVHVVTFDELKRACGAFLDDLVAARLWHRGQPVLDDAAAVAVVRTGDAYLWVRRDPLVAPLYAAAVAAAAVRQGSGAPVVRPAAGDR